MTSPVASSQNITVIRISFGSILLMALRASSSESLIDGSVLIMNLFSLILKGPINEGIARSMQMMDS